jgi:hypothetical protein
MIWFTWRQFRTQSAVAAAALVVSAVVLVISGRDLAHLYAGVAACTSNCATAVDNFRDAVQRSANMDLFDGARIILYALPALIGMFWGAPLVARELETGTYRLAWNQSVSRTRWLATKLGLVGGAAAAVTGLLSGAVTVWARHIDSAGDSRITPLLFGWRGIVPIGYTVFAFALGVTAGMLIRRTVPAMVVTLAVYVAAVVAMPMWVRAHLVPDRHVTIPLDINDIHGFSYSPGGGMRLMGSGLPNAWTISDETITRTGDLFTGPANLTYCGPSAAPRACLQWVASLGLRQDITYQPASHFWPLQWAETGIFVGAAALLAGFCFWWLRRRLA